MGTSPTFSSDNPGKIVSLLACYCRHIRQKEDRQKLKSDRCRQNSLRLDLAPDDFRSTSSVVKVESYDDMDSLTA